MTDIFREQEVHPDILEAMVELLSSSLGGSDAAPGISTRTYYWGELRKDPGEWDQVKTREEGRMISGGSSFRFLNPSLLPAYHSLSLLQAPLACEHGQSSSLIGFDTLTDVFSPRQSQGKPA